MKIRVLKAGQPTYWYANKIGEVFETSGQFHSDGAYRVLDCRDGTDSPGYVAQEDCEIVEEADGVENVTVLKDELGLDREYREVKRKANTGDLIAFDGHANGITAKKAYVVTGGDHDGAEFYDDDGDMRWEAHIPAGSYVLEPTDIIRIDGERFRMVEREANVGERVVIVNLADYVSGDGGYGYNVGDVFEVVSLDLDGTPNIQPDGTSYSEIFLEHQEYRVLVPVQALAHETLGSVTDAPQPGVPEQSDIAELVRKSHEQQAQIDGLTETVANLAWRVSELERGQVPKEASESVVVKTMTRDEIIEKAKADVVKLKRIGGDRYATLPPTSSLFGRHYDVKFQINRKKNTVVALVYGGISQTLLSRGIAKCAPSDCFNVHIGMAIALRRALGLDIPQEYVSAPQPDEARVGDVVIKIEGFGAGVSGVVEQVGGDHSPRKPTWTYVSGDRGLTFFDDSDTHFWAFKHLVKVLDDSRDGRYGEVYSA